MPGIRLGRTDGQRRRILLLPQKRWKPHFGDLCHGCRRKKPDLKYLTDHSANDFHPSWSPTANASHSAPSAKRRILGDLCHGCRRKKPDPTQENTLPGNWAPNLVARRPTHRILLRRELSMSWMPDGKNQNPTHRPPCQWTGFRLGRPTANASHSSRQPRSDETPDGWTSAIYVMDADGKNQTRLTDHSAEYGAPSWSPDGQRIAFDSFRIPRRILGDLCHGCRRKKPDPTHRPLAMPGVRLGRPTANASHSPPTAPTATEARLSMSYISISAVVGDARYTAMQKVPFPLQQRTGHKACWNG